MDTVLPRARDACRLPLGPSDFIFVWFFNEFSKMAEKGNSHYQKITETANIT